MQMLSIIPLWGLYLATIGIFIFYFIWYEKEISKLNNHLDELQNSLDRAKNRVNPVDIIDQIAVKTGQKLDVIFIDDIFFLQASGDYVEIHTTDNTFLKEQTMKYFDEHLPEDKFVRVHRSYIVNIRKIVKMEGYGKQSVLLTLSNGGKLKVSIAGYRLLKLKLKL
ncbi:hypothetical protein FACS1894178_1150 [Bacteroidia bacterium]|nr:hypothetical protein FACS1894178_1150 [Bacteroidia bacterium]